MSAAENKAATQAAYQAFGAGDLEGVMKNMADDIEWIVPGNSTISGTYRGRDEVAGFFMTLASKSFPDRAAALHRRRRSCRRADPHHRRRPVRGPGGCSDLPR